MDREREADESIKLPQTFRTTFLHLPPGLDPSSLLPPPSPMAYLAVGGAQRRPLLSKNENPEHVPPRGRGTRQWCLGREGGREGEREDVKEDWKQHQPVVTFVRREATGKEGEEGRKGGRNEPKAP
jgi:hypothetical protein